MSSVPSPKIERSGLDALMARMRPALVKYFRRKSGNADEAEDLAQDVLLRSITHSAWKSASEAEGYLIRAAVNRWRDRNRRAAVRGAVVNWDDVAGLAAGNSSPEHVVGVEQELERVLAAIGHLNERTRDVFMLIRMERMKQTEVSALLGISLSSVEKHFAKALIFLARFNQRTV